MSHGSCPDMQKDDWMNFPEIGLAHAPENCQQWLIFHGIVSNSVG